MDHLSLLGNQNLRPVIVPTPDGYPALRVSRHHRIMVDKAIAQRMFGCAEILAPAKNLVGFGGVRMDCSYVAVIYYHLLLDDHHVLNANGIAAESLHLGRHGLAAMSPAARNELAAIFPTILQREPVIPLHVCRIEMGQKVTQLARRAAGNGRTPTHAF